MDLTRAERVLGAAPAALDVQVVFATPSLSASVCIEYKRSICGTVALLMQHGISHGFIDRVGDAYLAKVRNKLATEFLESYPTCENFFFLDDDIGWPPEKVIEFLMRPEPVLAGIYPKKSDEIDFPVEMLADLSAGQLIERGGLFRALGVPTGVLRIKRHVLEHLAKKSRRFRDMEAGGKECWYYNIFETGVGADDWFWGEDYCFARKWTDDGQEVWVDPNIEFTHRGTKKWCNRLVDHLSIYRDRAAAAAKERKAPDAAAAS